MGTATAAKVTLPTQAAIDWLLASDEAGIRNQVRTDLLDDAAGDRDDPRDGPRIRALLSGQEADGSFGVHPYKKWHGAHWRLVSMVELGIPATDPSALRAAETVLAWITDASYLKRLRSVADRPRSHASIEGNALAVSVRLGLEADPRVRRLVESLLNWQWPDGGWNCDRDAAAQHSSFHESFVPVWALAEYARVTGHARAAAASHRVAELLLEHRLFRSHTSGAVGDPRWLRVPYPGYWHYNFFQGLTVLARAGALPDERADEAIELLVQRRHDDGLWHAEDAPFWRRSVGDYFDPAGWERSGPSLMLTLNALRVLRAARRA